MKKTTAITLSLLLVLAIFPMQALAESHPLTVTIDGKKVSFPDAQPYVDGNHVMLPIRFISEHLLVSITWNGAAKEVTLSNDDNVQVLQLQGNTVQLAGSTTTYAAALKKDRVYLPHNAIAELFGCEVNYDSAKSTLAFVTSAGGNQDEVQPRVEGVIHALIAGQFDDVYAQFDENMAAAITPEQLEAGWESLASSLGDFESITIMQQTKVNELDAVAALAAFSEMQLKIQFAFHSDGRIASLSFNRYYEQSQAEMPTNVREETVVIGENTDYPLGGTLTLPKEVNGPVPAVVLVHGSGPSDRDEAAYAYKPFRDIAWALAAEGIAVLRYDKRTYTYGEQLAKSDMRTFTAAQETVDDAVLASHWLKQDDRINASQVYIIGHSLGGMLAPRIDAAGGDFAGLILLAGTPRKLWEVMYDQNVSAIEAMDMDEAARESNLEAVRNEYARAQQLQEMTDEEAQQTTIFGIPAYYFKEMDRYNAADIAAKLHKPIFILQGKTDFQVKADVDYVSWQQRLEGVDDVAYALYPGLNHFFIASQGDAVGTTAEYQIPGYVDKAVLKDIADWIREQIEQ
ncbi:alpha/beta fold hydrolase [Paenibacillus sp. HB172176]|uniref:alpha/beta fold hydrolase n=1 Tax=Paenibacillus sp. HB172176 TaxID=2493690 RepID=UPI00143A8073|nr:alpha/beta fold hydrolase [Paenibacillus sp. HB172176]